MTDARMRFALILAVFLGMGIASANAQPTVSLIAVSRNGIPVQPTSTLAVQPNDVVGVDIYISGWGNPPFDGATGLLNEYRLTLAGKASAHSSGYCLGLDGGGAILPFGWDAPIDRDECPCENPDFPICNPIFGCVGPEHHPEWMAAIEDEQFGRIDGVFYPRPSECSVDSSSLDIEWSCSLLDGGGQSASKCLGGPHHGSTCSSSVMCPAGSCSSTFQSYAGTLYLKAGGDVCGTFTYTLQADSSATYLANGQAFPIVALPVVQPLTLFVPRVCSNPTGGCCTLDPVDSFCEITCEEDCAGANQWFGGVGSNCTTIEPDCFIIVDGPELTSPPHCSIDARRPFSPLTPSLREGFDHWDLVFSGAPGPNEDGPEDFAISQFPAEAFPAPPTISSVDAVGGALVRVNLSAPIYPNRWTCLRHIASNMRTCLGFLPADVNSNRTASPADILNLIDNLNGLLFPPLLSHQCDIDRSGACVSADMLTEIDLLNGARGYPMQNGQSLPSCPSASP